MEQTMSDQLTRSTVGRFNTEALERADIKTLYEVAKIGNDAGVFADENEKRAIVGLAPSVEQAAVPFSPPAAIPASFPVQQRSQPEEVRCKGFRTVYGRVQECGRLLGKVAPPYEIECPRCKATAVAA